MVEVENKALADCQFIDLFAGLGGFRLALESLGASCVYSSEWDKQAQKVYQENFGECPNGDITQVDEKSIPDHDICCAGFPCQAFSISGKMRGFEDSRGTLFFDVARIVKEKKPKVVFMENVRNFARHDGGRTLQVVQKTMEDLGYAFYWKVLSARDYGVPQKRERVYMVCFRKDLFSCADDGSRRINFEFPKPFPLTRHVEDFLLPESDETRALYDERYPMILNPKKKEKYSSKAIKLAIVNKGGQGERVYSTKGIAVTLSAYGGGVFAKTGGYLVNGKPRRLHPRECARLMGYPDSYKISKRPNQAYKQFGNSVVVDVLQLIAVQIAKALKSAN